MQFFGYILHSQQLRLIMSDNNILVLSANASPVLSAGSVLPLATFSLVDFEMQNATQFHIPEDQVIIIQQFWREKEEILQGQLVPSLPQGRTALLNQSWHYLSKMLWKNEQKYISLHKNLGCFDNLSAHKSDSCQSDTVIWMLVCVLHWCESVYSVYDLNARGSQIELY